MKPQATSVGRLQRRGPLHPAVGGARASGGFYARRCRSGSAMEHVGAAPDAAAAARRPPWWRRLMLRQRSAWRRERELAAAVLGIIVGASVMVGASIHGTLLDTVLDVL